MKPHVLRSSVTPSSFSDSLNLALRVQPIARRFFLSAVALLLIFAALPSRAFGQGCTTPPTWTVTIWFPNIPNDASLTDYVGGQSIPWFIHLEWNAPCFGTITVTSDYGQGTQMVATIDLSSTTGTYDNGSPQDGGPILSEGFPSPPPVGQATPWTIAFTGTAGGPVNTGVGNATLVPLVANFQFSDNKIIAASNVSLDGDLFFNADPSPTWFPNLSVQASNSDVSMTDTWPPSIPYTNATDVEATATESVDSAMPVTDLPPHSAHGIIRRSPCCRVGFPA